jgi:hypothetical protein
MCFVERHGLRGLMSRAALVDWRSLTAIDGNMPDRSMRVFIHDDDTLNRNFVTANTARTWGC